MHSCTGCGKDDAGDAAEEEHSGIGQAEELDLDSVDRDDQQQQQGEMAHEMADGEKGPQAANENESENDGDDDDRGDDIDDRDLDDDYNDYEKEGHPLSGLADPTVPVPDGHIGLDELEARFPEGTSDATRELSRCIIGRRFTSAREVTDLIRQQGADPDVMTGLVARGSTNIPTVFGYPLLAIAIDNKSGYTIRTVKAEDDDGAVPRLVALPHWSSDELQAAVLTALLDGGADPNLEADGSVWTPIRLATACGNQTAFDILMARPNIDLRAADECMVMQLPRPLRPPPPQYLELLLSLYERLVARDPTLATEERYGLNLVHQAAEVAGGHYPQSFIDSYLDLIRMKGTDMTVGAGIGWTPLHYAAAYGSPPVADYLCRKLPADQIDGHDGLGDTPLAIAERQLDWHTQQLQDPDTPEPDKERCRAEIPNLKLTIRSLLRAGADINLIPTGTEEDRRQRQLVLTEYATVLNELPAAVMSAVNAALAPHRQLAALLAPWLAVRPLEAPIFGWRIASYLVDMNAAQEAISEAIGVRHSDMARRVCAAAEHFVKSAVYQASSNREVVGGTADVGGQVVRLPQLQCFVLEGLDSRPREAVHTRGHLGLREVVHRARMDEAAKWGLADGAVVKGFNTHLGDADCQFTWQQLGAALQ
ncbi:unnamed protein product [Vitrella brassicaformis CCMP3155]|uniref:Uncharacterized protein n=1 Tax=Vitrella brassicaformis (strain CCMP3155) TaxID=1169540 RepID=A0A0G4EUQ3_VITBC|nr:unnamed protein product [Vitrella brassicaformis CCMP3155]|eukprot:CEM02056.1 unnamed protein product [Vitrella brassicaformis CCMP3155]